MERDQPVFVAMVFQRFDFYANYAHIMSDFRRATKVTTIIYKFLKHNTY